MMLSETDFFGVLYHAKDGGKFRKSWANVLFVYIHNAEHEIFLNIAPLSHQICQ